MNQLLEKRTFKQKLGGLLLLFSVVGFSAASLAQSQPDTPSFKTFQDWCSNRQQLSREARRTVDVLLQQVGTSDCDRANQMLSQQERLDLSTFLISDLSPLTGLTHLTSLRINNNQISDLTPLQSLNNLQELDLSFNRITNISPLQPLTQLTRINLSYNQISDISPLQSLTSLIEVYLNHNKIVDISDLKDLTKLRFLFIQDNPLNSTQCPINPKYVCRFDRE